MAKSGGFGVFGTVLFALSVAACSSTSSQEPQDSQHLLSTNNARILGFE
jgi:hypothetical protein